MAEALILKVTLEGIQPPYWRRLAVPRETTYMQLHEILQIAFDWENAHLWEFVPAWRHEISYTEQAGEDEWGTYHADAKATPIITDLKKGSVVYTYDFGANWAHRIKLETQTKVSGPLPTCLKGRGDAYLEDQMPPEADMIMPFDEDTRQDINQRLSKWAQGQTFQPPKAPAARTERRADKATLSLRLHQTAPRLASAWEVFRQTADYRVLTATIGSHAIVDSIGVGFLLTMVTRNHPDIARWRVNDWIQGASVALDDFNHPADAHVSLTARQIVLSVISSFMVYAVETGRLKEDLSVVRATIMALIGANHLYADDDLVVVPPLAHVATYAGRTWRQATATRLNETTDAQVEALQAAHGDDDRYYSQLADFAEQVYADYVLTVQQWQPKILQKAVAAWLVTTEDDVAEFVSLLTDYLAYLAANTSMTKKKARALQVAVDAAYAQKQRGGGRVISMKQAKKQLKTKKKRR